MASDYYAIATIADYEALSAEDKTALMGGVIEGSFDTCRKTLDGKKFLVKWNGESCPLDTVSLEHTDYTHAQILTEIVKAAWQESEI